MTPVQMRELIREISRPAFNHVSKFSYCGTDDEAPFLNMMYGKNRYEFNLDTDYEYAKAVINKLRL